MAIKERTAKVYETSDGEIFPAEKQEDAKNHQQSLDIGALKEKLEKQALGIFLDNPAFMSSSGSPSPLIRKEFEEINNLLDLDYLCLYPNDEAESELEEFENIIQELFTFLIDLFSVNPQKMGALTRMIDEHLEELLN